MVGINSGLAGCRQALILAAAEARMRNTVVRLVHGCEPLSTLTERQPRVPLEARARQARRQLGEAAAALRPLLDPGTTVEFRIDPRTGIDTLLDQSSTAGLIVLQRRDLTVLGRITAGSTSKAVAARAGCPVAVTRTGQGSSHGRGAVLVGIADWLDAASVLPLAFAEAAARAARVTAIQGSASEALNRWADTYPDVLIDRLPLAGDPVAVLRAASASAELLVIGRHDGQKRDGRSLGPLARQLIDTAQCPVLVPARIGMGADQYPVPSDNGARRRSPAASPR